MPQTGVAASGHSHRNRHHQGAGRRHPRDLASRCQPCSSRRGCRRADARRARPV